MHDAHIMYTFSNFLNMKKLSFNSILLICAAIIMAAFAAAMLSGCNTPKATQRKDDKAVARVLASDALTAKVGKRVAPCVNDTTVISDTVTVSHTDVVYDTAYQYDTLDNVVTRTKTITKTVVQWRTRTQTKYVADIRQALQWRDSTERYKNLLIEAGKKKEAKGWPWWVWLAIGSAIGAGGAMVVLRKVIPLALIMRLVQMLIGFFSKKKDRKDKTT